VTHEPHLKVEQVPPVSDELAAHPERGDDERAPATHRRRGMLQDQPQRLQLHDRLTEAELREDRTTPATDRPPDDVALMRLQDRVNGRRVDLEPEPAVARDLLLQEVDIVELPGVPRKQLQHQAAPFFLCPPDAFRDNPCRFRNTPTQCAVTPRCGAISTSISPSPCRRRSICSCDSP